MKRDFDVLVVGGGMVGAGFAALLGAYDPTQGLRVAMLEPRTVPLPEQTRGRWISSPSRDRLTRTCTWPPR